MLFGRRQIAEQIGGGAADDHIRFVQVFQQNVREVFWLEGGEGAEQVRNGVFGMDVDEGVYFDDRVSIVEHRAQKRFCRRGEFCFVSHRGRHCGDLAERGGDA